MKTINICMYGAASDTIADIFIHETEELGKEIGRRGHHLIYGGGSTGLMGACSRGVHSTGGKVTGIVPEFLSNYQLLHEDIGQLIKTKTMSERKTLMEDMADAFIVCPGGIGTMDEFFQIMVLTALHRKFAPIILYNIDGYYDDLIHFIDKGVQNGFIRVGVKNLFRVCSQPEEALDNIEYFS